jgi:hypothetical protein
VVTDVVVARGNEQVAKLKINGNHDLNHSRSRFPRKAEPDGERLRIANCGCGMAVGDPQFSPARTNCGLRNLTEIRFDEKILREVRDRLPILWRTTIPKSALLSGISWNPQAFEILASADIIP